MSRVAQETLAAACDQSVMNDLDEKLTAWIRECVRSGVRKRQLLFMIERPRGTFPGVRRQSPVWLAIAAVIDDEVSMQKVRA